MHKKINIFWFRRDLRLKDNAGLYHALKEGNNEPVLPIFIFDKNILDKLSTKEDRRVQFIYEVLEEMQVQLVKTGTSLKVFYDNPKTAFEKLLKEYNIGKVFTNHDYEPYAKERDQEIAGLLKKHKVSMFTFKDQVIFEKDEVIKDDGKPYTVFTPYSRKWKATLTDFHVKPYPTEKYFSAFLPQNEIKIPTLDKLGFKEVNKSFPGKDLDEVLVTHYAQQRNFPGTKGTSKLGVHLRFGTISIRQLVSKAKNLSETFLNELIWRDFYQMILWYFPQVAYGKSFKPAYDHIEWRRDNGEFEKWCHG
ncbi:MAG: deoxyribodipyrimidine photo-lyase, partial [Ferruginibacter sp.]